MTNNQTIAQNILTVIGSQNRLSAMIGAKDFVAIENGLQFGLKRASKKVNKIIIRLNSMDTYDVEFANLNMRTVEYKVINTVNGIYFDQLKSVIEENTGLYLTF